MALLNEWIINIIIFLLLAMVVDLLLPDTNMKKYVKLVTGLLLLAIIMTPMFSLISKDFDEVLASFAGGYGESEQMQESLLETKKSEIQAAQHAYILEQMAVQMRNEVEKELIDQFGLAITGIKITAEQNMAAPNGIPQKVIVYLETSEEKQSIVKPINIQVIKADKLETAVDHAGILTILSKSWDIPESKIETIFEEGAEKNNE